VGVFADVCGGCEVVDGFVDEAEGWSMDIDAGAGTGLVLEDAGIVVDA
jgi:hypothetical protein